MKPNPVVAGALAGLLLALATAAQADGPRLGVVKHPLYERECGSCHVAYPPALLPPASWAAVMEGLDRHFGVDASLDAGEVAAIRRFLGDNAGRAGAGRPPLRISETPWFLHEHREEVPAEVWRRKEVGSPSNCGACHVNAAQGRYDEHEIRVPGGRR